MKIRKALAVVLSLAMTVTLMPATAFASTASFSSVQSVKDGKTANSLVRVTLQDPLTSGETQSVSLEVTQHGTFANLDANEKAQVIAKNWTNDNSTTASVVVGVVDQDGAEVATVVGATQEPGAAQTVYVQVTDESDDSVDLDLTFVKKAGDNEPTSLKKDTVIYFYVNVEADGSDGDEVQVSLDGDGASVIDGFTAKTIATINGDGTTVTVDDPETVGRGTSLPAAEVTIKEVVNNAITSTTQKITLTLPKGVTWATDMNKDCFSGSMLGAALTNANITGQDTRYLTVTFTASKDPKVKEKLVINPKINISKDANKGDIKLKIEGDAGEIDDASDLVIAVYGDANVNILSKDADKLPEVVAGKIVDKDDDDFIVSITFEENSKDALTSEKYIDLAFNSDKIQVRSDKNIAFFVGDKYAKKEYKDGANAEQFGVISDIEPKVNNYKDTVDNTNPEKPVVTYDASAANEAKDRSSFTVTVPKDGAITVGTEGEEGYAASGFKWDKDDSNALTLFIPVTVSADYTGDITLTAKGNAGIDETTVTVAKVVAPVTASFTVTNVVNGAQKQATADVTITENYAGALADNGDIILSLDSLNLGGVVFDKKPTVTVTEGDIELKDPKKDNGMITIPVDDESSKASTITVSGLAVNLARILPEGEYDLKITGDALVVNGDYNNGDFSANAVKDKYINITTAADTAQTGIVANFYLDGSKNSTYTVNGTDATMDAAAYLDSNNRTMVPIRYVAYALGLVDSDISYNTGDNTATLSGLTNVVKVTTGSNVLQASNGNVTMDTVAVNNGGRLYVPARFIAQAFGAQVAWDQATKTVTITK